MLGGWTVAAVIQMQSGFPLGVSQNAEQHQPARRQRSGRTWSPASDVLVPGSITDRLRDNPNDNLYLNPAAFSQAPRARSATRRACCPASIRRGATRRTSAINKDFPVGGSQRATLRLEIINVFDNPWYAALQSTAHGNANFGRVNAQANYSRTMQFTARFSF